MDPVTLASAALTVLLPYLVKAGEATAEKIGATLPENAGKLWRTLTVELQGKAAAEEAVKDLVENPGDADAQASFRIQLKKALAEDPDLRAVLTGLLEKAQQESANSATAGDHGIAVNVGGSVQGNIVIGNHNAVNSPEKKKQ